MRNIKFRGKRVDNGKWIFGDLLTDGQYEISDHDIIDESRHNVIRSTVSQFTGLQDKNGTDIYEYDIMNIDGTPFCVYWNEQYLSYFLMDSEGNSQDFTREHEKYEVIGNVHDNRDLIK